MSQLLHGGEVVVGLALFVGLVIATKLLSPPQGTLQERLLVRFPGAWIMVGLPMTFAFGLSAALIAIGSGVLR